MSVARTCKSGPARFWESLLSLSRMPWDHELIPIPSQQANGQVAAECLLPSWEGSGVGRFMESLLSLLRMHWDHETRNWSAGLQPGAINVFLRRRTWRSWSSALRFMERSWSLRMYAACWLLTVSLATSFLRADAPASSPPASQNPEPQTLPSQSPKSGDGYAVNENAPAAPKPSIGKPGRLPAVFGRATPASLDDLKSIEQHVKALVTRISPAVVAVQVDGASGSGVVVSADGLVLTVAHVCEQPDREVRFVFPDGKTARGKTLGMNHEIDSGLTKITDEGEWPHVDIGDLDQTHLGDWVLALGHPGGFDAQRSVVARLGRIITLNSDALQTDCTIMAGDSGGPLFDMHGRVIGVHNRISDSTAENFHVPIRTYYDTWDRLAKRESWGEDRPLPREGGP